MTTPNNEIHFDPMNRIIWQRAIRAKQTTLVTRQGKRFDLDYDKIPDKVWFRVTPTGKASPLAPCGWLTIDKVLDSAWLR